MATYLTFKENCGYGRGYNVNQITIHGTSLKHEKSGTNYGNHHTITSDINNIPEMFLKMLQILNGIEEYIPAQQMKCPGVEMIKYINDVIVPVFTNLEKKTEMLIILKEQLNQQDHEIKSLKQQLIKKNISFDSLIQKLSEQNDENESLFQKLSEKDEEIEDLTKMNERFAKELNQLKQESERNNAEITDLKETTTHYNQALKEINKDLTEYAENLEKAERQNQEMTHLNHRLIIETSFIACRNKTHFDCEF